ncbi:MAG: GGDEF domain-containing protein, partial [Gemmatimonadota bacterium]|nr:GGDEF domain-containing protein [Gemmatimonadota bacterium]
SPQVPKAPARTLAGFLIFAVVLWTARLWSVTVALAGGNDPTRADLTLSLFAIGQMVIVVGTTVGLFWIEVRRLAAELHRLAGIDELTGLPNRRATVLRFNEEAARAIRQQRPYSIVVLDVDHFKRVNDTYGHAVGDDVLKNVARTLEVSTRGVDVVGRIGGEEFVVILSEESSDGAKIGAERLRSRIAESSPLRETAETKLTVSGGIATAPEDGWTWDELFAVADRRLYEAKRAGRNCVIGRPDSHPLGAAPSLAVLRA